MKGALFVIKSDHDVTDVKNQAAKDFREEPAGSASVSDLCARCIDHLDLARHFPGRGAIFANEEDRVGSIRHEVDELEHQLNKHRSVGGLFRRILKRSHRSHNRDHRQEEQNAHDDSIH